MSFKCCELLSIKKIFKIFKIQKNEISNFLIYISYKK